MKGRLKKLNEMQLKLTLHLSLSSGADGTRGGINIKPNQFIRNSDKCLRLEKSIDTILFRERRFLRVSAVHVYFKT